MLFESRMMIPTLVKAQWVILATTKRKIWNSSFVVYLILLNVYISLSTTNYRFIRYFITHQYLFLLRSPPSDLCCNIPVLSAGGNSTPHYHVLFCNYTKFFNAIFIFSCHLITIKTFCASQLNKFSIWCHFCINRWRFYLNSYYSQVCIRKNTLLLIKYDSQKLTCWH